MSASDRRAAARRKVWGRGPVILRFEPLEGRQLLSTGTFMTTATSVPATTAPVATTDTGTGTWTNVAPTVAATTPTATTTSDNASALASTVASVLTPGTPTAAGSTTNTSSTTTPTTPSTPAATKTTPASTANSNPELAAFNANPNLDWGSNFDATVVVQNLGTDPTAPGMKVDVYASTTPSITSNSVFVGTATVAQSVDAGGQTTVTTPMEAPPKPITGLGTSPSYYLIPQIASTSTTTTSTTTPSMMAATSSIGANLAQVVTITPKAEPNLVPTKFEVAPLGSATAKWGGTLEVTAQITNETAGTVSPETRARIVLVPTGQSFDSTSAVTVGELYFPAVGGGSTLKSQGTVYLPQTPPSSLAGLSQVTVGLIPDADYLTRPPLSATTQQGAGRDTGTISIDNTPAPKPVDARADLTVLAVQPTTTTLTWGQPFQVKATIANKGNSDAAPVRVRFMLLDESHPNNAPLAMGDAVIPKLQAGFQQDILQSVNLEGKLPTGVDPSTIAGRIVVVVDPEHVIDQKDTTNDWSYYTGLKVQLLTPEQAHAETQTPTSVPAPTSSTTTPPLNSPASTTTTTTTPSTTAVSPGTVTSSPTPITTTTTTTTTTTVSIPLSPRAARRQQMLLAQQAARKAARDVQAQARAARRQALSAMVRLRTPRTALRVVPTTQQVQVQTSTTTTSTSQPA